MNLKRSFLSLLVLVFLVIEMNAQAPVQQDQALIIGRKYFLKLEKARLLSLLAQDSSLQANEIVTINRLIKKNDSLLAAGNIYDSVSVEISSQLASQLRIVDSSAGSLNSLIQKIHSKKIFKKEYILIERNVTSLDYALNNSLRKNLLFYNAIDTRLDTSNLSGEKGRLKGMLNSATAQQEKEAAVMGAIDNKKDSVLASGEIEATVSGKIENHLQTYQRRMDSIQKEITILKNKIDSPKDFTKEFTLIKTKVILIDSVVNKNAGQREYVFQMIDEGLSIPTKKLFNLAAFFGPGGFTIPPSKYGIAQQYFSPIIDSLVRFSNSYEKVLRTVSIFVNGYADATTIATNSKLYNTLAEYLDEIQPDKQQLNSALSALRAEEISRFLTKMLKERYPEFKSITKIVFEANESGLGEKLPNPQITNYRVNDERRRVVIVYWSILPID